ncbi:MAG: DUF1573 domain-containing protein [Bacteroidota bacterium]
MKVTLTSFFLLILLLLFGCANEETAKKPAEVAATVPVVEAVKTTAGGDSSATPMMEKRPDSLSRPEKASMAEVPAQKEEKLVKRSKQQEKKKKRKRKKARAKFEQTVFDYKTIKQGDKVEHKFQFKNTGKTDLVVKNVRATCGCTQPSYPFIPIAPGEEGYIGVVFDTKGKLGKQKPMITVETNADPPTYKLYLDGYVDAN